MLNLQQLRDKLGSAFQPFLIRLTDGRSFEVPHPDFVAVGRGYLVLVDHKTNRSHTIDALHVISLDAPTDQRAEGGR
ncbi:MAG TPA: hypothetical protein VJ721_05055 [Chthoniobacterales bacterium]|nr:hypothetical protein [Chthoniobacterales bacterium]